MTAPAATSGLTPQASSLPKGRRAVFLDRDGTLNLQVVRDGKPYPPQTVEEFALFADVPAACRALKAAGYVLVVATNQPDVARGEQSQDVIEAMHRKLLSLIPEIDRIEVCYDPGRGEVSRRRKPEPGMLLDAADALGLDLARSWMVGDRWRDIDCGQRAGVRTVFIDFGYVEKLDAAPDFTVKSFGEAARIILAHPGPGNLNSGQTS
ncbi:MAG TPA: HAD-IIIA family hydrolase [Opitutaceae bacterium]|nr:HAD-IIIA family hydrolase [Opitutaceae bacterium]